MDRRRAREGRDEEERTGGEEAKHEIADDGDGDGEGIDGDNATLQSSSDIEKTAVLDPTISTQQCATQKTTETAANYWAPGGTKSDNMTLELGPGHWNF